MHDGFCHAEIEHLPQLQYHVHARAYARLLCLHVHAHARGNALLRLPSQLILNNQKIEANCARCFRTDCKPVRGNWLQPWAWQREAASRCSRSFVCFAVCIIAILSFFRDGRKLQTKKDHAWRRKVSSHFLLCFHFVSFHFLPLCFDSLSLSFLLFSSLWLTLTCSSWHNLRLDSTKQLFLLLFQISPRNSMHIRRSSGSTASILWWGR